MGQSRWRHWRWRLRTAGLIGQRGLRAALNGTGTFVVLTLALLVAAFYMAGNLAQLADEGWVMLAHPLIYPFFITVMLLAGYLALATTLAMARERDRGTLEVLFYGPVDTPTYILGKFFEQLLIFSYLLVAVTLFTVVAAQVAGLGIDPRFGLVVLLAVFLAAGIIGFGLLVGSLTRRTLSAVLLLLGILLFFTGVGVLQTTMGKADLTRVSAGFAFVLKIVTWIGQAINWLSPFAYLNRGLLAVDVGSRGLYLLTLGQALIYSLVLLGISGYVFARKGVRR